MIRPPWTAAGRLSGLLLCCLLMGSAAPAAEADCASCHDQSKTIAGSVHEPLGCVTCHEQFEKYPHPAGVPKPECATCHESVAGAHAQGVHGQELAKGNAAAPSCTMCHGDAHEVRDTNSREFRTGVPATCGMCHSEVSEQFQASVHGKAAARGVPEAPLCTDCHGEHNIMRPADARSPVSPGHIRETCASCHGDVRLNRKFGLDRNRVMSFDQSFHGLALKSGAQTVANCASCHGVHNILPSSDPNSTIHPQNLSKTCGSCHPGAGRRFTIGQVHVLEGEDEPAAMKFVRQFYLIIIPLTLAFMILHNAGDWIRKLWQLRVRGGPHPATIPGLGPVRMLPFERVQHGLLVISFTVLVWSGFALKYPDAWWARPLLFQDPNMRGLVHRIAGAVLIAVSVLHLVSLFASRRLRRHWFHLIPRYRDVAEATQNLAYNIGLRSSKPYRSEHSYIEKAEYWAVLWGSAIMALTGLMLWANNWMLANFPKYWLDVATTIHFYEAVLATLAIIVWHFYGVIFDPDVYPMDTAWWTGRTVRKQDSPEPPESIESLGD